MADTTKRHVYVGGRLIVNPTDNTTAPNYGGTRLGNVINLRLTITRKIDPITAEEWGSDMIDGILLGSELILQGTFTGWDEDLVNRVFYNGSVGAGSVPRVSYPISGINVYSQSHSLLWVADDETVVPSWLAPAAVPWKLPKPMHLSGRKPLAVTASWILTRNSGNSKLVSDLLANITI